MTLDPRPDVVECPNITSNLHDYIPFTDRLSTTSYTHGEGELFLGTRRRLKGPFIALGSDFVY